MSATGSSPRLTAFVQAIERLVERTQDEAALLGEGSRLLAALVATDDWLPDAYARPNPDRYSQYLLHRDPDDRFSLVSFVWGPGQATPVHDHTVWGLVGVLRGAELAQSYAIDNGGVRALGPPYRLAAGEVEAVSPTVGDVHKVWNAYDDRVSISIHLYGADIGKVSRHTFNEAGEPKTFISGYSTPALQHSSAA